MEVSWRAVDMLGGWRGRIIRGHLCGLQRQSSEHSGATQFTSMKNRCGPGTETRALTEKNRRGGRESARENKLDSRGRMRTVCVGTADASVQPFLRTHWVCAPPDSEVRVPPIPRPLMSSCWRTGEEPQPACLPWPEMTGSCRLPPERERRSGHMTNNATGCSWPSMLVKAEAVAGTAGSLLLLLLC